MILRLGTSALFAGLVAGLIAVLLQFWLVTPVLLEGEEYETGAKVHYAGVPSTSTAAEATESNAATEAEDSGDEEPENLLARHSMTLVVNLITYTGFGLVMVAGFGLASRFGISVTWRSGLVWGLAGFIAMHLIPAVGLPPELPGTPAADLAARQFWWKATVAAAVAGLSLLSFGRNLLYAGLGVVLILAPLVIGAPELPEFSGIAPPELSALFVARSLAVACAAWAALGAVAGYVWDRQSPTA